MSKRFASLFAAFALITGLLAPNAFAQLSVTATQTTGQRGDDVSVKLNIASGGAGDEVDLSVISAYTFNFLWDSTVLDWNSYSSSADLSAAGPTVLPGSAVFNWFDGTGFNPVSFAGGLSITANFHIRNDAAFGPSVITFGDDLGKSNLLDENFSLFEFSDVSDLNQGQMQVDVLQSTAPVPEPTEISMLLAGLGLMAAVIRRRKNRQA